MNTKRIGNSELEIAPIVFGGNVFGWTLNEKESHRILDGFVDRGLNAIDTANSYSHWVEGNEGGESEKIIGSWLKNKGGRDNYIIMTKVGSSFGGKSKPNTTKEHIITEVDKSLRRLNTDYIDLYQTHYDDGVTPIEETLGAYKELIKAGKVRYIGVSNISIARLEDSLRISKELNLPNYQSLQPHYNLYSREQYETEYLPVVENSGISVLPYYSLASGFLTGKYRTDDDFNQSLRSEGIKKEYWNDKGKKLIAQLLEAAKEFGESPAAVSLAWLLAQNTVTAPIASATKESHMDDFIQAIKLSSESSTNLNDIFRK